MPTLTMSAYCGMSYEVETGERPDVRREAALLIKRRRKEGFPVSVLEKGREWEIEEHEGCAMIPDTCGILALRYDYPQDDEDDEDDENHDRNEDAAQRRFNDAIYGDD